MKILNFILAIVAIVIGIIAFFLKGVCRVDDISLSIIAICTTLIVGLAVVDTMRVHQLEQKIKELDEDAAHLRTFNEGIASAVYIAYGMALLNWKPYTAFNYFLKSLKQSFISNNAKWIGYGIKCMKNVPIVINRMKKSGEAIDDVVKDKFLPDVPNDIQELELYTAYKSIIDDVYKKVYELSKDDKNETEEL